MLQKKCNIVAEISHR